MSGTYAKTTTVTPEKSLQEIKSTLIRFGANRDSFTYAERGRWVGIQFDTANRTVRLEMTLPDRELFALDRYRRRRIETAIDKDWDQACRQRWRTLTILVKAKMAAIEDGISTFEREFMADLLLPSGQTVGQAVDIDEAMRTGDVPSLVPSLPAMGRVIAIESRTG